MLGRVYLTQSEGVLSVSLSPDKGVQFLLTWPTPEEFKTVTDVSHADAINAISLFETVQGSLNQLPQGQRLKTSRGDIYINDVANGAIAVNLLNPQVTPTTAEVVVTYDRAVELLQEFKAREASLKSYIDGGA